MYEGIELMKTRETVVQLRRFDVEEKQQKVVDLDVMIAEFTRMAQDLDHQIAAEEARAGVTDSNHYAYPPFAKAAAQRRDNLVASVHELRIKLQDAMAELEQAKELLQKAELREERRGDGAASDNAAGPATAQAGAGAGAGAGDNISALPRSI